MRPPSRRSLMMARRRSIPRPARCSRSRCRPPAARTGPRRCAACRRPTSRCMWCCRKSTDGSFQASSASNRPAGAIPTCSLRISRIDPTTSVSAPWPNASPAGIGWRARRPASGGLSPALRGVTGRRQPAAHAVGLDALASVETLLGDLGAAGFDVETGHSLGHALGEEALTFSLAEYRAALEKLPIVLQENLEAAWGAVEDDPHVHDGVFRFAAVRRGKSIIAVQPERGDVDNRDAEYHDLSRPPRHAYVAFYLWLRGQNIHALIHMGAHGTLEWLGRQYVGPSPVC